MYTNRGADHCTENFKLIGQFRNFLSLGPLFKWICYKIRTEYKNMNVFFDDFNKIERFFENLENSELYIIII